MKKTIIYLVAITILFACSQTPSYLITGDLTNQEGTVYLAHNVDGKRVKTDSTELIEGKFTFEGSVTGPEQYFILFKNNKKAYLPFIIENATIHITADLKDLWSTVITGSASQDVMNSYQLETAPYDEKYKKFNQLYSEAKQANDSIKIEEILADYDKMSEERADATLMFIKNNHKSYAAALIALQQIQGKEADEIDELIDLLDASLMNTDVVIEMKKKANFIRNIEIGKTAPDFVLNDPEDHPIKLSSLFGNGYLLVDFWAAWCGPCRAENPHILAAYNEFHAKGFNVIGISLDRANKKAWKDAILEDKLPWVQVLDYTNEVAEVANTYVVTAIPANFLLNSNGVIIAKNLRGEALTEKLAELLNE